MALLRPATAILILCSGAPAMAAPQWGSDPSGNNPLFDGTVPLGSDAFGPGGPVVQRPDAQPPKPAAEPHPAPAAPPLSAADRRKQRLDDLYRRLADAKDEVEAHAIGIMIKQELLQSGSDTADLLMQRALTAIDAKNYTTASALLDKIIVLKPHWAEAWNERATVRYLDDDDVGAMADIGQVLAIEPRHFGALSGMGFILHRNGDDKDALTVFRRATAINPQDPQVKTLIEQIAPDVEGHEL